MRKQLPNLPLEVVTELPRDYIAAERFPLLE